MAEDPLGEPLPAAVSPEFSAEERAHLLHQDNRNQCLIALKKMEELHAAVEGQQISLQHVLDLDFVVQTAWNHRHTARKVMADTESAYLRFARETPGLVIRVSRLLEVTFNLNRKLQGYDLVADIYNQGTFWVELRAVASLETPQNPQKPGPEWAKRADVRARYFKVWEFLNRPGNSTKSDIEVQRRTSVNKDRVKAIRNETRPPTADEIAEDRRQAKKK